MKVEIPKTPAKMRLRDVRLGSFVRTANGSVSRICELQGDSNPNHVYTLEIESGTFNWLYDQTSCEIVEPNWQPVTPKPLTFAELALGEWFADINGVVHRKTEANLAVDTEKFASLGWGNAATVRRVEVSAKVVE